MSKQGLISLLMTERVSAEARQRKKGYIDGINLAIKLIEASDDEPQKPVVPHFVAEWIEYFKNCKGTLYGSTNPFSYYGRAIIEDFEGDYEEALRWIRDNSDTYARAWLDGYEVEEEKRYIVKMKGISGDQCYLNCINNNDKTKEWILYDELEYPNIITKHTRKDLEDAGFGWVFDCPGIEIEEVE